MSEAEWLACQDPVAMIKFLRDKASDRRLRLWACAVCRAMGSRIGKEGQEAVAVGERFADGKVGECDLVLADEVFESHLLPVSSSADIYSRLIQRHASTCLL